jgi:acyl-CoA thioester hydrolase|tara:strand:- start:612 stop:1016 length:405 start_codon:yes stop_codon:yes gene_type:complete
MADMHVWSLRVYYEDTDAGGIVYYANYLKFVERARTELLRERGIDHQRLLADAGLVLAVRDCAVEYFAPARLDDAIEVHTRVCEISAATICIEQTVLRGDEALASARLRIVCLRQDGRPARLPIAVRDAVTAFH